MEYRYLGKTGLKISRLGFGGIPIQRVDQEKTKSLMEKLLSLGVNYIDTARGYTVSEEYLGYALSGIRDKFILATKSMARTREAMEKDIEISLKNLKTDTIDLYQVHNASVSDLDAVAAPGGALEALFEAKEKGKIGHIGVTMHSKEAFEKALSLDWVETIMFPYNLVETHGEDLIQKCKEKNIGFIVMKPLAGGALEDANLAIRYILNNDAVSVVIPGMYDEKEAEQNVRAAENISPLTDQEYAEISRIRKELGNEFCRRCNYCQPCTVGINISGVFLFEGYLKRYGLGEWAKGRYETLNKKAKDCIECGVCETRCPYNLPIRQMLKRASLSMDE
ncbi:MAG: aldo/keto reductase [Clostridia bacterium]|nr:aldo/keto reductase [Clostridia bacterium]